MIANRTDDSAELAILGDIGDEFSGGVSDRMFHDELKSLGDVRNINITLNSGGGLAFSGVSIMNMLKSHPAYVTVEVVGLAASAASIIAMGADTVIMRKAAMMMVHLPFGLVIGNAEDMRKQANILDQLTNELVGIYKAKTGKRDHTILKLLQDETWMNGQQAVEMGFADKVIDTPGERANIEPGRYLHCPPEVLEAAAAEKPKLSDPWRSRAARRAESLQF